MRSITDKEIINYLLGRVATDREDDFLAKCFSSDENAEKFESVRDALIEKHLRGDLSGEDKSRFENHFLNEPQNSESVNFSKRLRGILADNKQLAAAAMTQTEKKPFSLGSVLVPATAFGVLLLGAFLVWQLALKNTESEIVEVKPTPIPSVAPQVSPTIPTSPNVDPTPSTNPTPSGKTFESPKPNTPATPTLKTAEKSVLAFTLPLIGKGNEAAVLKIEKPTKQVNLQTAKPFKEFPAYRVEIQKDAEVSFRNNFEKFSTNAKGQIVVKIPAENLKSGKNRFIIFGINKDGTIEELIGTERFFAVERNK